MKDEDRELAARLEDAELEWPGADVDRVQERVEAATRRDDRERAAKAAGTSTEVVVHRDSDGLLIATEGGGVVRTFVRDDAGAIVRVLVDREDHGNI